MFDNIGEKIKTLAKVISGIGIACSVIVGITLTFDPRNQLIGILVIFLGSLFSWVSCFFTYGFGELIANTSAIEELLQKKNSPHASSRPKKPQGPEDAKDIEWAKLEESHKNGKITEEEYQKAIAKFFEE